MMMYHFGRASTYRQKSNFVDVPKRLMRFSSSPNLTSTSTAPLTFESVLAHRYFARSTRASLSLKSISGRGASLKTTSDALLSPLEYLVSLSSSSLSSSPSIFYLMQMQIYLTNHLSFCSLISCSYFYLSIALALLLRSYNS